MPRLDLGQTLVDSRSSAASDWGSAAIAGKAYAEAVAELRHGFKLDVGAGALAALDLAFRKYVAAAVNAEAHAEVRLTAQAQLPMNLFKEAGLAVRLQASAEAAAGASLTIGLVLGDFIALVERDLRLKGIPFRLLIILLEESIFGGGVYAKAAVCAMAYAKLIVAGRAIAGDKLEEKPGFKILAEYGVGLKAGCGYRAFIDIGIANFRRFVSRSSDALVDSALEELLPLLPPQAQADRTAADVLGVIAKIVMRSAFEAGELIALGKLPKTPAGRKVLARRVTDIAVEETQRFILERVVGAGLKELQRLMLEQLAALTGTSRDAIEEALRRFTDRLWNMPEDPFQAQADVIAYWRDLTADAAALIVELQPDDDSDLLRAAAMVFAGADLLSVVMRSATKLESGASFANVQSSIGSTVAAFTGSPSSQPPAAIKHFINNALGRSSTASIKRTDEVQYVVANALDLVEAHYPEVTGYLQLFQKALGQPGVAGVANAVMSALGPIAKNAAGNADENATFEAIIGTLQQFMNDRIDQNLAPLLSSVIGERPDVRMAVEEVMLPTIRFANVALFDGVRQWGAGADATAFQEALSAILMTLVGRSVVVVGDVVTDYAQQQLSGELNALANRIGESGLADVLDPYFPGDQRELVSIVQEALQAGAELFGPLAPELRTRLRGYMYQALSPVPLDDPASFNASIADAMFVPNAEAVSKIAEEYSKLTIDRLQRFIARLLRRALEMALEDIRQILADAEALIRAWIDEIGRLAKEAERLLLEAATRVIEAIRRVEQALSEVATSLVNALSTLKSASGRAAVKSAAASEAINAASGLLFENDVYKALPGPVKQTAQDTLKTILNAAIDNVVTDTAMDAIGSVAWDVNSFLADVRKTNGSSTAISNLILNKVTDAITSSFGGVNPGIDVSFSVSALGFSKSISLGRAEIPILQVVGAIRSELEKLQVITTLFDTLANKVAKLFAEELSRVQAENAEQELASKKAMVDQQLSDSSPRKTGVVIVTPIIGAFSVDAVDVEIHLGNVPRTYLALGPNEQQRVFVHVNGASVALQRFNVQDIAMAGFNGGLKLTARLNGEVRDGFNTIAVSIVDGYGTGVDTAVSCLVDKSSRTNPAGGAGSLSLSASALARHRRELTAQLGRPVRDIKKIKHIHDFKAPSAKKPKAPRKKPTKRPTKPHRAAKR